MIITKNKHLSYTQAPQLSLSNLHIRNQRHNSIHAITISNINIVINQQLYTISHNQTKEESTSHHDKNHVQHLLIIHTSSNNHIKLFTKYFQGYPNLKTVFDKVRLPFYNFKTIETNKSKPSKKDPMPQLCIHLDHI